MKHWKVHYSIRWKDKKVEEYTAGFEAETIDEALRQANEYVNQFAILENVDRIVIWDIGMVEMSVF